MKYSFHPGAEKELNEAKEVYSSIQNILLFPQAWTSLSKNTRRCLTNRFPYGVIFEVKKAHVFIIAVMQLNREPDCWKERKKRA